MNKSQILALMMRRNNQMTESDLLGVAALLAETLADVVDRLSEDEFYRFVGIGSAVYNHGVMQLEEDSDAASLPSTEDSWLEASGARHSALRNRH